MEEAKSAVKSHVARNGERETSVHEVSPTPCKRIDMTTSWHLAKSANPAVEHEYVQPEQHENVYRPVDREVHKDHHHTKVQPIQDKEVLPEKHTHVQEGPAKREVQHGSEDHARKRLNEEASTLGLHSNQREVGKTQHTRAAAPSAEGKHVHHHVHEHVQPVTQKETVQPHVVHRTKPIHEVHQHEPEHHGASILPPVTREEFERQGGSVHGSGGERSDAFAGEPVRLDRGHIGGAGARGTTSLTHPDGASGVGYHAPSTMGTTRGENSETGGLSRASQGVDESGGGYGLSSEGRHNHGADSRGYAASGTSGAHGKSSIPRDTSETRGIREPITGKGHDSIVRSNRYIIKGGSLSRNNPKGTTIYIYKV